MLKGFILSVHDSAGVPMYNHEGMICLDLRPVNDGQAITT